MRKLTDEEKIEIVEKYLVGDTSCNRLGKEYGVHRNTINNLLRVRGIEICKDRSKLYRRNNIDENYFDDIDSEDKAYFLGLLYADGCNHSDCNSISIGLEDGDKEILIKLANCMKSTYKFRIIESSIRKIRNKECICKQMSVFQFSSKRITERLVELGCPPKKTFLLKFPTEDQVPSHLIRHFIRGYWDGDGSFSLGKRKGGENWISLTAEIVSTNDFCLGVVKILKDILNINANIYKKSHQTHNTTSLQFGGRIQVYKLLSWLYNDCNYYLDRKYNKFREIEKKLIELKLID